MLAGVRGAVVTRVGGLAPLFRVVGFVVGFLLTTVLIALIFRFPPDVRLRWRDVAPGAAVTSLLFAVGKIAIGFDLGRAAVGSAYGLLLGADPAHGRGIHAGVGAPAREVDPAEGQRGLDAHDRGQVRRGAR